MEVHQRVKLFLIGDLPLGSEVLKHFHRIEEVEIVGVLVQSPNKRFQNDPFEESKNMFEVAKTFGIKTFFSTKEVLTQFDPGSIDVGISCRASIIYKPDFISIFKHYFINMHGGILPSRAGVHIACHVLIEGDRKSGGTLHLINKKIDDGAIIDRLFFDIEPTDTALSVYKKTNIALLDLVKRNTKHILGNELKMRQQEEYIKEGEERKYFNKDALSKKKQLTLDMRPNYIDRVVRACDFPGHEPAYIVIGKNKLYLTTQRYFNTDQ